MYQEDFNRAYLGLRAQGLLRATNGLGFCSLLTRDGLRCALGHLVSDAKPGRASSAEAEDLLNEDFYKDLRYAHDAGGTPGEMKYHLEALAKRYGLTVPKYQADFNRVYLGLRAQGFQQAFQDEGCVLLTESGQRCALGFLVADAKPGERDNPQAHALREEVFYSDLQVAHDLGHSPLQMKQRLQDLAERYHLTVPEVNQEKYQEDFNRAYQGLRAQGFQQALRGEGCVLLTESGQRCALGFLVTDAKPGEASSKQQATLRAEDFYCSLQRAHDFGYSPSQMKQRLHDLAERYGLTIPEAGPTGD